MSAGIWARIENRSLIVGLDQILGSYQDRESLQVQTEKIIHGSTIASLQSIRLSNLIKTTLFDFYAQFIISRINSSTLAILHHILLPSRFLITNDSAYSSVPCPLPSKLNLHTIPSVFRSNAPNGPPPLSGLLVWTSPRTISSDRFDDFINSPRPIQGCSGPVWTNSLNGPVVEFEYLVTQFS